MGQVA